MLLHLLQAIRQHWMIFEQLHLIPALHGLIPFVRQWYSRPTTFLWYDSEGQPHEVTQGDGGEQGDALMPGLFCLALRGALAEIQELLPPDCFLFAYLDDIYIICPHANLAKATFCC